MALRGRNDRGGRGEPDEGGRRGRVGAGLVVALAGAALAASLASCRMTDDRASAPAASGAALEAAPVPKPRFVPTGGDDRPVATIVQGEVTAARAAGGRAVLVYVGATWCEPCQRFHAALAEGKLDAAFPGLALVEFDLDRDRDRLAVAGYAPRYIPMFALPRGDGRASGKQTEGSVKGDGAVTAIEPRLRDLLAAGDLSVTARGGAR